MESNLSSRKLQESKQRPNQISTFPAGLKFASVFNDPDEMSSYSTKWGCEYFQISKGKFNGTLKAAHTGTLQIAKATWTSSIMITGDVPENSIVFTMPNRNIPPIFHNENLYSNELAVISYGDEIDFLSKNPQDMYVVSIDKDLINRYSVALLGKEVDDIQINSNRLKIKDRLSQMELSNLWEETINLILSSDLDLSDIDVANKIEDEMIRSILYNSAPTESNPSRSERHRAAKQARQYILENSKKQISILDICEAVCAAERTLYLGFGELYGLTPKAFLKYLRLHQARRELLLAEPGTTVTNVAYRWKFYHLSRFATYYYEVFNEYPSETLKHSLAL
jgi:AraC family ethanolamine operon transcriptional activator